MNVLIAVSGTGGHIYPALSLAHLLIDNNENVSIIGNESSLTKSIIEQYGINFYTIPMTGWQGRKLISFLKAIGNGYISLIVSIAIIIKQKPNVIVCMGGYVSLPVSLAGKLFRIPIVIHEQNCYPGLANRIVSRLSKKIALGFDDAKKYFSNKKTVITGNPLRNEFYELNLSKAKQEFNIPLDKKVVLVYGGSQGSHRINELAYESILNNTYFKEKIIVIHITGKQDYLWLKEKYKQINFNGFVFEYLETIYNAFAVSDLIVSRSGASTCSEILVSGKPAMLVPFPFASDNHQKYNAEYMANLNIAICCEEKKLDSEKFQNKIIDILENRTYRDNADKLRAKILEMSKPENELFKIIKELAR